VTTGTAPGPTEAVRYRTSGGVATLTMDQPHNRNALTSALRNGLGDGLAAAVSDRTVRVIVLTHTGPVFCAGADISESGGAPTGPRTGSGRQTGSLVPRFGLAEILAAIQDSPKPVVARIAGHCLGGGVGLAAACDVSIAALEARFGFTEVRLGLAPAIISVVCLPKLRRADALELFLTGERVSAPRAAVVGLITSAVPAEDLGAAVAAVVANLQAGGPEALAAAKRLVFDVPAMGRAEGFEYTTSLSDSLFASAEGAEGMAAFRERRQPSWHVPHPGPAGGTPGGSHNP
jgi:methylglutaconyl-CoA hydratase